VTVRSLPRIHLLCVAGSCRELLADVECKSAGDLIDFVQSAVGPAYWVTGDARLIEAPEDDASGGRSDDARRARDLQRALTDDCVAAIVSLRGGAWLTRVLPLCDFDVLVHRTNTLSLFGFSELTTVMNIAACYPRVRAYYDFSPSFLLHGLQRHAREHVAKLSPRPLKTERAIESFAEHWARRRFRPEFAAFFEDVASITEGRGSSRAMTGRLATGRLPRGPVTFVGGNLTLLSVMCGTPYVRAILPPAHGTATRGVGQVERSETCRGHEASRDPAGLASLDLPYIPSRRAPCWLAMEDCNESPSRVDRLLAHLKLAGVLDAFDGVLLGDFDHKGKNRTADVLTCLRRYVTGKPIVVTEQFGHVWPMSPLPLRRPCRWVRDGRKGDMLRLNWGGTAV